ncbi:cytochrome C551 [Chryseobacterium sp. Leaf405]|uniref:cytochrome C551 n=1 Tax=Chryseobacterium sp. Leaf405 TaxID=1736367 RepID=UPI0009EB6EB3|nr:cytochrome C551 [Chryseobacterium sp. Leaf405]
MKKLLLIAAVGIFAVSCGTKESSMSTSNADSTVVDTSSNVSTSTTDSTTTKMANPDSMNVKTDSAATPPVK